MARLSLSIDRRTNKNGMCPIRLRINHKGTSAFVGTGVSVEEQYFIAGSLYDPIHKKAYMAIEKRDALSRFVRPFDEFLTDTDKVTLGSMTANDIRDRVLGVNSAPADAFGGSVGRVTAGAKRTDQTGSIAGGRSQMDFVAFFEQYGESRRTVKTQDSYAYAARVLREYCGARRLGSLTFVDIDYARLVNFARWLDSTGRSPATRHMLESYVRAAYKDAQKRRLVSRDLDPYFDYSIKPVPLKDIETLKAEEMHALMVCEPKLGGQRMGRDIALMSFYLCGANLIDLYEMKDGKAECVFVRHKIEHRYQRELHIRIEPELAALVERYKGDRMLLVFKSKYPNYESFRHKIAHRLRELSGELGFAVTMPKIRRTWATIAGELECPDSVINKSMGHVDATVNDRSYKDYKWSQTAKWNRRVIDYVLNA